MYNYRIANIRLELDQDWSVLPEKVEKACGLRLGTLASSDIAVRKESLDARKKKDIHRVVTLDFKYRGKLPARGRKRVTEAPDLRPEATMPGNAPLTGRPLVVGFGPCGIFAALSLAEAGYAPIIVERGCPMERRVADVDAFWQEGRLDPESNVLFGEGGAGTFSDGKLTTGIKDPHIHQVLTAFVEAGAPEDIAYAQKPHIGTDILRGVVVALRKRIEAAGGEICFNTQLTGLEQNAEGALASATLRTGEKIWQHRTNAVILALGHSARDTFRALKELGVPMAQKPLSIGVRLEHPQRIIDQAQYGGQPGLPPASYKLSCRAQNGRGVYSFCMCPGGEVVTASTQPGMVCVNGMSNRKRDSGTANAGILVDVRTEDFPSEDVLAGIAFQEYWERRAFENGGGRFAPPRCSFAEFRDNTGKGPEVAACLPDFAVEALREAIPVFGKRIRGFDADNARVTAVETRSSSPVRILRNDAYESALKGLYPAGEGAGYAGGITSAACDGLRVAEAVIRRFAPPGEKVKL
ncbi:FAD-dependent protein [Eubacterium sp. 1001713B170207_170306_E7]|uniref:NAD(P)/FAD-dependent oxidoreductase n=1 Tax=Eubacterium sp. 1001713B170207_170306_E7 TaxID=2787097 RepID=UPI001896B959|nr:NAD(FAD)-utilizing dehydrogenase [Eubacterium sp. 1001713B170207_170306_E7]